MSGVLRCASVTVVVAAFATGCGGGRAAPADTVASADAGRLPRGLVADVVEGLALAGDNALIAQDGPTESSPQTGLGLIRVPLAGAGRAPATVAWPNRPTSLSVLSMDASRALVALTATPAGDEEGGWVSGLFGGPATGPVGELEPVRAAASGARIPRTVEVDGSRLFVGASDGRDPGAGRFTVRTAGAPDRSIDLPPGAEDVTFAGDFVAYAQDPLQSTSPPASPSPRGAGQSGLDASFPHHVFVRDWRTGVLRAAFSVRRGIGGLAVSRSGAVAVGESHGGVVERRPGRPLRRIARSQPAPWPGATPVYAGERLVLIRRRHAFGPERLVVSEPAGRTRAFGAPGYTIGPLAADERRVLWATRDGASGCVVVADLSAPAAPAIAAGGPCTRTAIDFPPSGAAQVQRSKLRRGGRVGVTLVCVAAPPSGCRGMLEVTDGGRAAAAAVRFAVATGRTRHLVARLTSAARARVLRSNPTLTLTARAVDPDGRGSEHSGELRVER